MVAVACTGEAESTTTAAPVLTTTTPEATTTAAPTTTIADACRDTFCVRYNIRPEAAWADGTPVTAEDFVFTTRPSSTRRSRSSAGRDTS